MSDAEGYQAIGDAEAEGARRPGRRTLGARLRWPLMIGVPLIILGVVAFVILTGGRYQTTDDAYVQSARAGVSASIPGRVVEIEVKENQAVRKGQVLFKLDPADYQVAVEQAEAALAAARYQAQGLQSVYAQRQADIAAAQETVGYTAREARRQQDLAAAGVSSRAQADQAAHAAEQARRQLAVAQQQATTALADLGGRAGAPADQHPRVLQARADLDRARLNLGYAVVVAPVDGVVTKVEQLQVGNRVAASQTLFWLVSGQPWIEANFKENQLAKMRVGQSARITIDAYDHALNAHIASFSPGTGSSFALLPPENATGNWVKVVQRLPVRLALDEAAPGLSAGLSAKVKVDTRPPQGAKTDKAAGR
ncbi:HlyD family secretion protein [Caulobacter sp. CCUG 60055]|uniref:HlyD family efflux transporter periplasmic adaptor subunit n=1 Tax=Caulobacter sp. CCUG 60055 TaxID=2100090 RepID=UPI001FA6D2A2|nr:HlyD family secretion protein [Caulobacteraceae bacterium]MCI3181068.1 HlyD family secretion protein [Caulobacter sp. CCUG 60055]